MRSGVQLVDQVEPGLESNCHIITTQRCVYTGAGRSAKGAGGATTAGRIYRGRRQPTGRSGCHIFLSVSTAVGYAITAQSLRLCSYYLCFHTETVEKCVLDTETVEKCVLA